MNKITYDSEMLMSECIDNSMEKIEDLKEWMRHTKNENILDALQEVVELENEAISEVLENVIIN